MASKKIMVGSGKNFRPKDNMSHVEVTNAYNPHGLVIPTLGGILGLTFKVKR